MALDDEGLGIISNSSGNNNVFMYSTADAAATVEANGYFDASKLENLAVTDDVLIAFMGSNVVKFYKITRTDGDIALSTGLAIT